jgi:hypothetical protein
MSKKTYKARHVEEVATADEGDVVTSVETVPECTDHEHGKHIVDALINNAA